MREYNLFQKCFFTAWEAPQNALGYIISRQWKKRLINLTDREKEYLYGMEELTGFKIYVADYYSHKADKVLGDISGFSMGKYICLNSAHDLTDIRHEKGHSKDSKKWGWLYLPVIGIYSAVFCNLWDRRFHSDWNSYDRHYWYYKTRWTEKSADRKGKADRDKVLRRIPRPDNARYPAIDKAA
jgi:hypothetical protein